MFDALFLFFLSKDKVRRTYARNLMVLLETSMSDEMLDIVDDADLVIGQELRSVVHSAACNTAVSMFSWLRLGINWLYNNAAGSGKPAHWRSIARSRSMSKPEKPIEKLRYAAWPKKWA